MLKYSEKPLIDCTREEKVEWNGKWRCLWFHINGTAKIGEMEFNTEKEADNWGATWPAYFDFKWSDGTYWSYEEMSHYIPMPAGDA